MKITEKMKVKEVLDLGDHMLDAFFWLAPAFERLRYPKLRRAMSGRVTVAQAARIGRVPLAEALFVLNLAAGCDPDELNEELCRLPREDMEYRETNSALKPSELLGLDDNDPRVVFVDVTPHADSRRDPMPDIARGLVTLKENNDVLLIRHPFDPIPLRDMFARRKGLASWAEERHPGDWFIYFYRPTAEKAARAAAAH
ncbi:MAG: DUF2249 domain-containing protein [Acidobacteria bacterium]|nr:DUF2249 domain-containing protein [Acidobacteriota bacterium]